MVKNLNGDELVLVDKVVDGVKVGQEYVEAE